MLHIWYLPEHRAWICACEDAKLYRIQINKLENFFVWKEPVILHSDLVSDCIEIASPFSMCTFGLDKKIVFYSLSTKQIIRIINDAHLSGIQTGAYMSDFGGNLITCAFDLTARVWSPGNIYGDCLLGELKGHNHPICDVAVLPKQPFVVTVDLQNIIIIWDVRNLFRLIKLTSDEKVDD